MKKLFLLFALFILFIFPKNNFAQRKKQPDKNQEVVRSRQKPINVLSNKSDKPKHTNNNSTGRIRTPQNNSSKTISSNNKDYTKRPPKIKPTKKKKKKIIIEEYVEVIEPVYIVEETIIYYETPSDVGYCEVLPPEPDEIEIVNDYYPDFPLRFSKADILYEFTNDDVNYYNLKIEIEATYDNYFETFGILIKYFGGSEQVILFNNDHEILRYGENYNFSKQIKIKQTGYLNLRLGYYDEKDKLFYPEKLYPNRTDILIFLEKENKVYHHKETKYITH